MLGLDLQVVGHHMGPLIKYFAQFVIILSLGGTSLAQVRPSLTPVAQACKFSADRVEGVTMFADLENEHWMNIIWQAKWSFQKAFHTSVIVK